MVIIILLFKGTARRITVPTLKRDKLCNRIIVMKLLEAKRNLNCGWLLMQTYWTLSVALKSFWRQEAHLQCGWWLKKYLVCLKCFISVLVNPKGKHLWFLFHQRSLKIVLWVNIKAVFLKSGNTPLNGIIHKVEGDLATSSEIMSLEGKWSKITKQNFGNSLKTNRFHPVWPLHVSQFT